MQVAMEPGASGDRFGSSGKGVDVLKKAQEIPSHPKTWHGILCMRHGPCGMEALLVQEIDSEGYWKIFVSDLGDRKKLDTFGRNYVQRVLTMDTTQLSFLASLSFTEFAHLVTIYREEEHKNDGDAPGFNVCVQRLCAEAYDRPIFEAARRQLEWVDLNPNWNSKGDRKQGITPVGWQAFLDMARQTLLVGVLPHAQRRWGPPKGVGEPNETRLHCALGEFREEVSSEEHVWDLESLVAPDLGNLSWLDVGTKPNSLFSIQVGPDQLMPVTLRHWKPKTSELSIAAWKTAEEIRHIVNPLSGGAVITHKEIIRELDRRGRP
jgi:hypothetical protein